jgi:hypothetical protein
MIATRLFLVWGGADDETKGLHNAGEVDKMLSKEYPTKDGWKLHSTHLGNFRDGGVTMVYVFEKE